MTQISITANGQTLKVADQTALPSFLESQQLQRDRVIVEYNGHAITPQAIDKVQLKDGDVLEIVRIVAGG